MTGLTPSSKTLAEDLRAVTTALPRAHPIRVKCGELATLSEEIAATRAELTVASSRLAALSPRGGTRLAHAVWDGMHGLVAAEGAAPPSPHPPSATVKRPQLPRLRTPQSPARSGGAWAQAQSSGLTSPTREKAAVQWEEYVKSFEKQQKDALLSAQRAAEDAAAESEAEDDER